MQTVPGEPVRFERNPAHLHVPLGADTPPSRPSDPCQCPAQILPLKKLVSPRRRASAEFRLRGGMTEVG